MKPPTPMSQDSRPEHIFNVRSAETPSLPIMKKMKARFKWRKLFNERSCDACGGRLNPVIAFKQTPISYCPTCEEEKEL